MMQKKLFATYLIMILLTIIGSLFAFWHKGYTFIKKQNDASFLMRTEILADEFMELDKEQRVDIEQFCKDKAEKFGLRVTIISMDGTVLGDSEQKADSMENHFNRHEVREAIQNGRGSSVRYSRTLGVDYHYSAVYFKDNKVEGIIRLSTPLSAYQELGYDIINSMLILIAGGIVLALLLAIFFTRKITKPIAEVTEAAEKIASGDYEYRIYTSDKDHIGSLAKSFNKMSKNLSISVDILTSRKTELEAILSSMSSGVVAIDRGNNIMFFNHSFLEIFDIKEQDIENEPLFHIVRNATLMQIIDEVKEKDEKISLQGTILKKDVEKIISITGVPLEREDKKVIGTLLVTDDISRLKKLENIRKEFVSNVTHELKTPLTSIRGFVDTLKNGAMDDPVYARHFLDIIDIEAERLSTLIQDILVLSEIETGNDDERSMCHIETLVEDVSKLLSCKMKPNVQLICNVEENLRDYLCNPFRMKEVFLNLMDNAIKYTEEGVIEVTCREESEALIIRVSDTGIGISEEHLPRLFERFYRVDKGRSRKQGGTGLGLSIVKHIVELYNGQIEVKSELGNGTIFTIRFPY